MTSLIDCAGKLLDLSQAHIMGVLNVTPDSFSDGGRYSVVDAAVARARELVAQGASIVDVGGESTRPGATAVAVDAELERVIPVIEAVVAELPVIISVDTSKPAVMSAAVAAGAGMINDVRALQATDALAVAARCAVPVCLMHMLGDPRSMQQQPHYDDVVNDVKDFLKRRIAACEQAGIPRQRLLIDPGFGFGKSLTHNLSLMRHLHEFSALGLPMLVGVSRKSMIGAVLDVPVEGRLYGSIALATLAAWQGAAIIRAHDVAATRHALQMCAAVRGAP